MVLNLAISANVSDTSNALVVGGQSCQLDDPPGDM